MANLAPGLPLCVVQMTKVAPTLTQNNPTELNKPFNRHINGMMQYLKISTTGLCPHGQPWFDSAFSSMTKKSLHSLPKITQRIEQNHLIDISMEWLRFKISRCTNVPHGQLAPVILCV
ncbi:hypothetical protein AVEN_130551-1 [Araneus ventricosus]|uniref:Uncharacterized protein n=1 Tax=Araneus ventricosus TaxID=182803 RepID=A0A4Y2PHS4_ARAVE|nr:hypothetical protein AVEN_130551-1 [Araneus ventricosus]